MLQTLLVPPGSGHGTAGESPDNTMEFPGELEQCPVEPGWESWECSSCRREGCVEISQHPPGPEGATEKGERLDQQLEWQDKGELVQTPRGKFRWDIGKEFLPVRVVRPWHRVPRETVAVLESLEVSKARLEHPGVVEGVPAHGRGLGRDDP
ncbi:hypothetical protein HGM15179_007581 [Zosterops borbonicus]|uniref:Uncharacterized protein n=1 Tax=Zosterops borbonicus TaxID=364589 RepID=A0A8K1GKB0_9PASS|nr:hypothetical protein HGM15179_007581 [Zosterops borbonicus]